MEIVLLKLLRICLLAFGEQASSYRFSEELENNTEVVIAGSTGAFRGGYQGVGSEELRSPGQNDVQHRRSARQI